MRVPINQVELVPTVTLPPGDSITQRASVNAPPLGGITTAVSTGLTISGTSIVYSCSATLPSTSSSSQYTS